MRTESIAGRDISRRVRASRPQAAPSSSFLEAARQVAESAAAPEDAALRQVYDRLTQPAKETLRRLRMDQKITVQDWKDLAAQLLDQGAITQSELQVTSAEYHLIPLGYTNAAGQYVEYNNFPGMADRLRELSGETERDRFFRQLASARGTAYASAGHRDWEGDLLEYLDHWVEQLRQWQRDLRAQRNADGSPKFEDFSPITDQVEQVRHVSGLLRTMMRF